MMPGRTTDAESTRRKSIMQSRTGATGCLAPRSHESRRRLYFTRTNLYMSVFNNPIVLPCYRECEEPGEQEKSSSRDGYGTGSATGVWPSSGTACEMELNRSIRPFTRSITMSTDKAARRAKFEGAWLVIKQELLDHFNGEGMPKDAAEWYERNLEYNVPGGKLNRGMSVVDTVEILKGRTLNDDEYLKAAVLGWGVELLQAFFLVSDDMMDSSITRRGQPCWYRVPRVGSIAINDSFMLEAAIYHLLKKHFRSESYYIDVVELFLETSHQTEMGQLIDLITASEDEVDLSKFSLKKHSLIVIYKTAYYSFYLPVALALFMCHVPTEYILPSSPTPIRPYDLAKSILIPLGEYFQVQDDFLDFSGTPEQIGKIGTDILDNKCSWCINTALSLVTPEQRKLLDDNYGRKDKECEAKVKALFEELKLREIYAAYEQKVYRELNGLIDGIPEGGEGTLKRAVFTSFLGKIYQRQK